VSDHTQVRMMVLGYGYWGVNQARNVAAAPTAELVAIVEPDPGRAAMAAQRHPGVLIVSTPEAALAAAPEAAIIATPASTHREVGDSLLGAGIHLLVEKPFAMTGDDARALVAAGAAADRHVVAGHTFLYSAPVRHLKMLIERGDLGEIRYLSFQRLSLGRIRSDCNVLWNLAPHDVSIALHLLGAPAAQAAATGHTFLQPDIADVVFGSLTFPSGAVAGLHLSWLDPRKTRMVTVVGTERMAVYDDVATDRKIEVFDAGVVDPHRRPRRDAHDGGVAVAHSSRGHRHQAPRPLGTAPSPDRGVRRADPHRCAVPTGPAHAVAVTDALEALDASIAADGQPVAVRTERTQA
jgi:predicted dehydrogenase